MIYQASAVRAIHLEVTSRCNAACPMCARNVLGGKDNPYLPLTEISLDAFVAMMDGGSFLAHVNKLFMCGNYGDPVAAKDTLRILEFCRDANPEIRLGMNSNASARDETWWHNAGLMLSRGGDYCKFSIDGLEDTNHLYRRGTDFKKIIRNAAAFIDAGGIAHWDFIVFKHNEHQIEEARQMAFEMGFEKFAVKKTGRFFSNTKMAGKDHQEVHDRDGNVEYVIEKPTDPQWQNTALANEQALVARYGSMDAYLDQTPVSCKTAAEKSIYISAEGLVFPCCWTANQMYVWHSGERAAPIWNLIDAVGGKDALDATKTPINTIIEGPFFQAVEDSWGKPSCKLGKLKVCAKTCGQEFDPFKAQFQG